MKTNGCRFTLYGKLLFVVSISICMSSCISYSKPSESTLTRLSQAGWSMLRQEASGFSFLSWSSPIKDGSSLLVFIEGDGRAWASRRRVSRDPSPANAIAGAMALASGARNILYIARPCQFLEAQALEQCDARYWTSARYGAHVVQAMSKQIDEVLGATSAKQIILLGYSGGGTLAALLAAQRTDVDLLITFAGNLDVDAWTRLHNVSPLTESQNPVDYPDELRAIRQHHFVGAKDRIVPPGLVQRAIGQLRSPDRVRVHVLTDYDHDCCWLEDWPKLICEYLDTDAPTGLC